MNIDNLILAFDIGYKSCESGKGFSEAKLDFIEGIRKIIKD